MRRSPRRIGAMSARAFLIVGAAALVLGGLGAWTYRRARNPSDPNAAPEVAPALERSRAANPAAWERRVILLGFDSCDGDLVDELIRRGKLPNFARLRREGAYGLLESTQPLLSPIIWTSIATGMPP